MSPNGGSSQSSEHDQGKDMPQFGQAGRVLVPVVDQDAAIAFYTTTLEFSVVPFGEDDRWV